MAYQGPVETTVRSQETVPFDQSAARAVDAGKQMTRARHAAIIELFITASLTDEYMVLTRYAPCLAHNSG
jgi:hypothetical protein